MVPEVVSATCLIATLLGMLFEILAIVKSVQVSILGPGLALRGSEGSMTRALSVMRHEQRRLHWQFYIGLFFFHVATGSHDARGPRSRSHHLARTRRAPLD